MRILRDFLFSSSFAPPKFSFCFRAVMETRLAWDGECYTRSDFLEWYGEDQGFVIWENAARAKDVVASAKDVTTSYKAAGAKATEIVDTATVNFVAKMEKSIKVPSKDGARSSGTIMQKETALDLKYKSENESDEVCDHKIGGDFWDRRWKEPVVVKEESAAKSWLHEGLRTKWPVECARVTAPDSEDGPWQ